ncbi:sigma-70 family RNA polymerase sigma factor [Frankia sp. ArI3]|uniref:sigma-70 family RNA polymerase sigma factor n=1 Tax=Frankia sp. ArI3 TaxID=1858 RepID=UPI0021053316|nr:sigma-70 family RNA polymerase sigma factor [Frankia sp. ArI3]
MTAPLPAAGPITKTPPPAGGAAPATTTAPAHPNAGADAVRVGPAARRGRTAAGELGAGSPAQGRGTAAPDGPTESERAALVARARQGDTEAFGLLYDHYAELVFRYALYRLGGDPAAAEDIVSETFLRALRTIGAFRWQGRDIGAWFVTIARNLLIDQARSARRRFEIPTADILAAADERATALAVPGPEESIVAVLTHRELLDAVRRLRPDQQECIALRFLEGLSVRETALAMGRTEGAVRALQLRAIRALARSLPAAGPA